MIFDVWITDADAPTFSNRDPVKVLAAHERRRRTRTSRKCSLWMAYRESRLTEATCFPTLPRGGRLLVVQHNETAEAGLSFGIIYNSTHQVHFIILVHMVTIYCIHDAVYVCDSVVG